MAREEDLRLEIEGGGVEKKTVDAKKALELAAAYLDFLEKISAEEEPEENPEPVRFYGLEVVDKCVEFISTPDNPIKALVAAEIAKALLADRGEAPRGLGESRDRLAHAVGGFGEQKIVASIGKNKFPLVLPPAEEDKSPFVITTFRATLNGLWRGRARFSARREKKDFSVKIELFHVVELGHHMLRELDIKVKLTRDLDGNIESAKLLRFYPVSQEDPTEAWQAFYRQVGGDEWDRVDNLEEEIKRRRGERREGDETEDSWEGKGRAD
jgi:hypothetical protein